MIPALTEIGRSFKGAAAYYLHDKRQETGEGGRSAERVAWTEVVNLTTDDPDRAWRMMTHTAMAQADLKQAAGIKATGRKLTKPVLAYSLSWHPAEKPDRAAQVKAARETLSALGLDGHQAIIVCHNDEPHSHVHVLVNRVHPETGVAATLSNSKLKLSEWALAYERAQGKILCPDREKNADRRKAGEQVDAGRKSRAVYEFEQATGNDNLKAEFVKTEQQQQDTQLYQVGRDMRAAHTKQWQGLARTYATVKARMVSTTATLKEQRTAEIKEQAKPRWRQLFQQQRQDRAAFEAAERGPLSKLWNIAFAFQAIRQHHKEAGALAIFLSLISAAQRRAVFDTVQDAERRALSREIKREIAAAGKTIEAEASRDQVKLRTDYLAQCAALRATQDRQLGEYKIAWKRRAADRSAALKPYRAKWQSKKQGQSQSQARRRGQGRSIRDDDRFRPPKRGPGPA